MRLRILMFTSYLENRAPALRLRNHTLTIAVAAAFAVAATPSFVAAQSAADAKPNENTEARENAKSASTARRVEPVVVTGNPFERASAGLSWSVLQGDALTQRQSGTLGETLSGLPGIASTYFGPNSSRPIIRGLDSERIRVLENGASSVDAASLSFDHAVPVDPIAIERVEILRGPSALLYGGGSIGGVVNAISNRIPRQTFKQPTFTLQTQFGGAERVAAGAIRADATLGEITFHADASRRETEDLRVPEFTNPEGERAKRIVNSALEATSAAFGFSRVTSGANGGFIGASFDTYRSKYGVVVEPDVTIDLKRDKLMIAGEQRFANSLFNVVSGHFARTQYEHKEIDGSGEIGTVFKNRGYEWRIEAKTAQYGPWRSVVGASGDNTRFLAVGEEAFVPPTKSSNVALFAKQDGRFGDSLIAFGARYERSRVSTSEVLDEAGDSRFGPADSKRLSLLSGSLGLTQKLSNQLTLHGNLSYSERAPSYFERYADGIHVATAAYERGDRELPKEKSTHFDLGLAWQSGNFKTQLTAFASRHRNFVSLDATGENIVEENGAGETVTFPIYQFRGVPARFYGAEWETNWRVIDGGATGSKLDLGFSLDTVRATNRLTNEPLPRIAPTRATFTASYRMDAWHLRGQVIHAAKQDRIPNAERFVNEASDGTTKAYTMVNLSLSREFQFGRVNGSAFVKLVNLTNQLGYNASSIRTVRELSPLPGRGVRAGFEVTF
jgi:iron complex outermembrane recepter protein